jgi:hypothetical protein
MDYDTTGLADIAKEMLSETRHELFMLVRTSPLH